MPHVQSPSQRKALSVRARRAFFESYNSVDDGNPRKVRFVIPPDSIDRGNQRQPLSSLSLNMADGNGCTVDNEGFSACTVTAVVVTPVVPKTVGASIQLKDKISDLQQQIQTIDKAYEADNLHCDLVHKPYIQEEQLLELNKKLLLIQAGLRDIDGERIQLVNRANDLENEKKELQTELYYRENKIESLQKLMVMSNDKVYDNEQLRTMNEKLTMEITALKSELAFCMNEKCRLDGVEQMLKECQIAKTEIEQRLQHVTNDHIVVTQRLKEHQDNLSILQKEKREMSEEYNRLQQQCSLELDRARLGHIKIITEMKEKLKSREEEVKGLNAQLLEKTLAHDTLSEELSAFGRCKSNSLQELTDEFQNELRNEEERHKAEMATVKMILEEKCADIRALQDDVGIHMQKLMKATSDLEALQEDSKLLSSLMEDVEALEHDRCQLQEKLHERDTEIAELSAEILKLEIEKELAEQHSVKNVSLPTTSSSSDSECTFVTHSAASCNEARGRIKEEKVHDDCDVQFRCDVLPCDTQTKIVPATSNELKESSYKSCESSGATEIEMRFELDQANATIIRLYEKIARLVAENQCRNESFSTTKKNLDKEDKRISENICPSHNTKEVLQTLAAHQDRILVLEAKILNQEKTACDLATENENKIKKLEQTIITLEECNKIASETMAHQDQLLQDAETKLERNCLDFENELNILNAIVNEQKMTICELYSHDAQNKQTNESNAALEMTMQVLTCTNEFSQKSLHEAQTNFEDERTLLLTANNKIEALEKAKELIQKECCQVLLKFEEAATERESLSLQLEAMERRVSDQKITLQTDLFAAEEQLITKEQQLITLEEELQARTNLLGEVVHHSEQIQEKLEKTQVELAKMEERSSVLQVQLQDMEEVLDHRQEEWRQKEDKYLGKIQDEQHLRESCQENLRHTKNRLESIRYESKERDGLEKENEKLKDKVRRQESYLKRKLEQERATRDRQINPIKTPGSVVKTQSRVGKALIWKSTPSKAHTRSTSQETDLDWELEALLAD